MGSELRRQLREVLGPDIKGLQRAVALEIADDARYNDAWGYDPTGRRSKARLADLVRWTAAKDELSVREMLRRLSVAGWEFRLPIGTGRDGRPLYAVPGTAMQFRVPDFKAPTVVGPMESEGPTVVGPMDAQGPTVVAQGPTTVGEGPTVVGKGPTVVGPPSLVLLPVSPKTSPTTSVAEVSSIALGRESGTEEEGGGGDSSFPDTSKAKALVDALDYRGRPPGKKRQQEITALAAAALASGWTEQDLKVYLDLGGAAVQSAAAVYAHRLAPDELPDAQSWQAARRPALKGTDAIVAGWMDIANDLAAEADGGMWGRAMGRAKARSGYRPSDPNAVWERMAAQTAAGAAPDGAEGVPPCGDPDCDPITRTREKEESNGLKSAVPCTRCHPAMRF
ncbi:hypothetical protein GCM10011583_57720 [Streptomyces camponoticapitis]|uniref:Uncharacterized protein n=1 Tax=Streptomyces camponoticapitis TaxID=1616125 RepID=A0ABQ2ENM6_9ACTN|nr:hypothetical protein [Streptomyces camponoticapitis]GGK18288.1 hypothetical protein GCM10011583_57720 [Streptomyces camponoticapitis]